MRQFGWYREGFSSHMGAKGLFNLPARAPMRRHDTVKGVVRYV